jgi:hypothetical protein
MEPDRQTKGPPRTMAPCVAYFLLLRRSTSLVALWRYGGVTSYGTLSIPAAALNLWSSKRGLDSRRTRATA